VFLFFGAAGKKLPIVAVFIVGPSAKLVIQFDRLHIKDGIKSATCDHLASQYLVFLEHLENICELPYVLSEEVNTLVAELPTEGAYAVEMIPLLVGLDATFTGAIGKLYYAGTVPSF
jgi:hypothetical protein